MSERVCLKCSGLSYPDWREGATKPHRASGVADEKWPCVSSEPPEEAGWRCTIGPWRRVRFTPAPVVRTNERDGNPWVCPGDAKTRDHLFHSARHMWARRCGIWVALLFLRQVIPDSLTPSASEGHKFRAPTPCRLPANPISDDLPRQPANRPSTAGRDSPAERSPDLRPCRPSPSGANSQRRQRMADARTPGRLDGGWWPFTRRRHGTRCCDRRSARNAHTCSAASWQRMQSASQFSSSSLPPSLGARTWGACQPAVSNRPH